MPRPSLIQHLARNSDTYAKYEWNFDQGSAAAIDQAVVRITPRLTWDGQWSWYAVKNTNLRGKTPGFAIAKANHYSLSIDYQLACWSNGLDSDAWTALDNIAIGATDITFSKTTPFPPGTIYIAHTPIYPFSRTARKMREWTQHAYAGETASTTNFVIAYATPRSNGDGRTAPPLPFYAFKISSTRHAYARNKLILASHNHPSENPGPFQLEGALTWLLAGGVHAEMLLDYFDVYVYPCLNPQGVWGGFFRSFPEDPAQDHNRIWNDDTYECAHAFRDAMTADTGDAIDAGIDFHSFMSTTYGFIYSEDHTEAMYTALLNEILIYDPAQGTLDQSFNTQLHYWWRHTLNASLSLAHEVGISTTQSIAQWKAQGEYTLHALANLLAKGYFTNNPGVGSRDFNGTTDRIDWANAWNPTGSAITISAWILCDGIAGTDYFLCIHDAADTAFGIVFYTIDTNTIAFLRNGATDLILGAGNDRVANGVWQHVLVTHDGVITTAASAHIYISGSEATFYKTIQNGATETAHTGSYSSGGRIYDDNRNFDGHIAQLAVWDHVLTPTEIANLVSGYAPDLAEATGLKFYFKGNTASLTATPGGLGTADGTAEVTGAGNGPPIFYT